MEKKSINKEDLEGGENREAGERERSREGESECVFILTDDCF